MADTLAKVASNRMLVPNSMFASDLREPSVRYNDRRPEPEPQEVMALREAPEPNLKDPD